MPHPHQKLTVYQTAMAAFTTTHRMLAAAGSGFASDKEQLRRAMSSVVRNIAEGAGRWTKADKRARYIVARGESRRSGSMRRDARGDRHRGRSDGTPGGPGPRPGRRRC